MSFSPSRPSQAPGASKPDCGFDKEDDVDSGREENEDSFDREREESVVLVEGRSEVADWLFGLCKGLGGSRVNTL